MDSEVGEHSGAIPVVLIHGALRGKLGLVPAAKFLERRGFRTRIFGYPTRRGSLADHAERLERFVQAFVGEAGTPTLGFLTHSMGGLVARAYLARDGAARHSQRQRLVMLAPPNLGSRLAELNRDSRPFRWLYGNAARELLPDVVRRLPLPPRSAQVLVLAGGKLDGSDGFHPAIHGNDDGVVAVAETRLGEVDPRLVGGLHSFLQWRRPVLAQAALFLARGAE